MPAAIDIALSVRSPATAEPTARQLHAAVASVLSYAEGDHRAPIKPFSVWPLHSTQEEPDRPRLRIGWLATSHPPAALVHSNSQWRFGSLQARAVDVSVEERSFAELVSTRAAEKVVLHVLTPTVFTRQDRRFPLPDPYLIYGGLIDRWNTFTTHFKMGVEARRDLIGSLEIKDFDIQPDRMLVDRTRQPGGESRAIWHLGFRGSVTVGVVPGSPDWVRSLLPGLSEFAGISGIGSGTARGFGACIPELVREQEQVHA